MSFSVSIVNVVIAVFSSASTSTGSILRSKRSPSCSSTATEMNYYGSQWHRLGAKGGKTAAKNMTAEERTRALKKASCCGEEADGGTTRARGETQGADALKVPGV